MQISRVTNWLFHYPECSDRVNNRYVLSSSFFFFFNLLFVCLYQKKKSNWSTEGASFQNWVWNGSGTVCEKQDPNADTEAEQFFVTQFWGTLWKLVLNEQAYGRQQKSESKQASQIQQAQAAKQVTDRQQVGKYRQEATGRSTELRLKIGCNCFQHIVGLMGNEGPVYRNSKISVGKGREQRLEQMNRCRRRRSGKVH